MLAAACIAVAGLLLPPVARRVGGLLAVLGVLGMIQHRSWAPPTFVVGAGLWLVGHWSFAARNDARYRSRLARAVFDSTVLRWTLPQYHAQRKQYAHR